MFPSNSIPLLNPTSTKSSDVIDPEEVKFLYQYDQAEYLDESEWKSLIKLHTKDPFKENYFDVLVFPPRLKGKYDQKIIDVIINALRNGIKSIGVTAHAGEGKTVLLHGLTYDLAIKHNIVETVAQRGRYGVDDQSVSQDHIVTSIQDELEVVPEQPVPIFLAMDKARSASARRSSRS